MSRKRLREDDDDDYKGPRTKRTRRPLPAKIQPPLHHYLFVVVLISVPVALPDVVHETTWSFFSSRVAAPTKETLEVALDQAGIAHKKDRIVSMSLIEITQPVFRPGPTLATEDGLECTCFPLQEY